MPFSNLQPQFLDHQQSILKYGHHDNIFNLSSLTEFNHLVNLHGFAIKYVFEGVEHYKVNRNDYQVKSGSYLLLNGEKETSVKVDSKQNVKGICINISNQIIADAIASYCRPDTAFVDPEISHFFYTDQFLENQYQSLNTHLGQSLNLISKSVHENQFLHSDIQSELFFELAEKLVLDQMSVFKQLQTIKTIKKITQYDLYRRLIRGKDFIDANFTNNIYVEQIALEATMSTYHFFRLFKAVFQVSPHQYILSKRLNKAKEAISKAQPISEVAIESGFNDLFSFSKAFKKHTGIAPSLYYRLK